MLPLPYSRTPLDSGEGTGNTWEELRKQVGWDTPWRDRRARCCASGIPTNQSGARALYVCCSTLVSVRCFTLKKAITRTNYFSQGPCGIWSSAVVLLAVSKDVVGSFIKGLDGGSVPMVRVLAQPGVN